MKFTYQQIGEQLDPDEAAPWTDDGETSADAARSYAQAMNEHATEYFAKLGYTVDDEGVTITSREALAAVRTIAIGPCQDVNYQLPYQTYGDDDHYDYSASHVVITCDAIAKLIS